MADLAGYIGLVAGIMGEVPGAESFTPERSDQTGDNNPGYGNCYIPDKNFADDWVG